MCCPGRGAAAGLRLELRERDAELRQRAEELRRREEQCARSWRPQAPPRRRRRGAPLWTARKRARTRRASCTPSASPERPPRGNWRSPDARQRRAAARTSARPGGGAYRRAARPGSPRPGGPRSGPGESRQESRALRDSGRRLRGEAEEQAALLNACRQESEAASRLEAQEARLLLASLRQDREADEARRSAAEARSRQRPRRPSEGLARRPSMPRPVRAAAGGAGGHGRGELRAERREVRCERQAAEVREQAGHRGGGGAPRPRGLRRRRRHGIACAWRRSAKRPRRRPRLLLSPAAKKLPTELRAARTTTASASSRTRGTDWKFAAASSSIQGLRCLLRDAQDASCGTSAAPASACAAAWPSAPRTPAARWGRRPRAAWRSTGPRSWRQRAPRSTSRRRVLRHGRRLVAAELRRGPGGGAGRAGCRRREVSPEAAHPGRGGGGPPRGPREAGRDARLRRDCARPGRLPLGDPPDAAPALARGGRPTVALSRKKELCAQPPREAAEAAVRGP
ncbi:unnamed protein product [Prorocentrum cordatum]|uniref:Uncharacterized protein n=1 Tax=Prorocentrum cordatum TaxID=2364126 RepID=A0ABN9T175_9DINO|nr:unnamed protein product [Polarella glacialis]